jgi:hypothetical protein
MLRVIGQILTDFTPVAFPLAGVSGLLEVSGLALWGAHLALIMAGKPRLHALSGQEVGEALSRREIRPSDRVSTVLDDEPRLLDVFQAAGFTLLSSPRARLTVARVVTLRQACRRMGVDEGQFVAALNEARTRLRSLELPFVSVSVQCSSGLSIAP